MKLKAIAVFVCCGAIIGLPAAAQATAPIETTIYFDGGATVKNRVSLVGHLGASSPQCVAGRTVKLFFFYGTVTNPPTLVDTDVTSANGVWAAGGDSTDLVAMRISVTRKDFGVKKHRRTCVSTHVFAYI